MKKTATLLSRFLPLALLAGGALTAHGQVTYSQVPLTAASFTADVIANGAAANPVTSSTTADADGAGFYFISQDYYTATTAHTSGIPNDGAIQNTIAGPAALTYQLASLSANNSLRLAGVASGTLTFATPRAASDVYVLAASGSGISTVDVTVNYADGTTTAFAGQTYPDWFTVDATRNVFGSSGRGSAATPISVTTASNSAPFLTQLRLPIPSNKLGTNITGITFSKTATTTAVLNIMAVSVGSTQLCTAPPTTATAVASTTATGGTALTTACSGTNIYLSVSGVPGNGGYTYQWQSSTTSATTGFTNITGATSSTYTATGQTVATYYRVLVSCQFSTSTATASTAVQVAQSPVTACYCTPTYSLGGSGDIVARVRLGTLDNDTRALGNVSPYYHDYSSAQTGTAATLQLPSVAAGTTATVTLDFGTDGTQYSGVWIDFNQDGTFDANTEFFAGARAGSNGTTVISVAVPGTATAGNTKMRVRGGDDNALTGSMSCGASASSYGEAEDYLVNITAATCSPTTATFGYGTTSTFCTGGTTNPTVTLATGATAGTFSSTTGLTISATTGAITLSSSTAGTYTVTNTVAATATACSSTATTTVTLNATPATPTITVTGTPATGITLTSSVATTYQWYRGGVAITGATNRTYIVLSGAGNGSYTVVVTTAGCSSAASAATSVTVTGTTAAQGSATLTLAPNPTPDGRLTLTLGNFRETVELTVLNTLGQRVAGTTVAASALGQPQQLDLSALPAGVYVLQARTASGEAATRRLVRE